MKIYILRHGIAADHDDPRYPKDSERPLTDEGRRKTRAIAETLARLEIKPDVILASPLVRAQQTAEIVATVLRRDRHLQVCEPLDGRSDLAQIITAINKLPGNTASVMLVGHEPDLSALASLLLTGRATGAAIELKKGGLCVLETEELQVGQCATLLWLAPPKLLV